MSRDSSNNLDVIRNSLPGSRLLVLDATRWPRPFSSRLGSKVLDKRARINSSAGCAGPGITGCSAPESIWWRRSRSAVPPGRRWRLCRAFSRPFGPRYRSSRGYLLGVPRRRSCQGTLSPVTPGDSLIRDVAAAITIVGRVLSGACESSRNTGSVRPAQITAPTTWEWLTEFAIPLLGALGSIAVAAIALVVTTRLAQRERADRARSQRAEFAASVDAYLATRGQSRDALFDAAAVAGGESENVVAWLEWELAELITLEGRVERDSNGRPIDAMAWREFVAREVAIRARVREWVRTGVSGEKFSTPESETEQD